MRLRCALLALILLPGLALAARQRSHLHQSQEDYLKGEFEGVGLTDRGRLFLAPAMEDLGIIKESYMWTMIPDDRGYLIGTGNDGRVYRLRPDQNAQLVFDSTETGIVSLVKDRRGVIYAGSTPAGIIYRIPPKGTPEVYFETRQDYVWDLAIGPKGDLFAATGPDGQIFRITGQGEGEVYYDSMEAHVTNITMREGIIFGGTFQAGNVLKVTGEGRAQVLYDNPSEEVSAIVFDDEDRLFFSAMDTGGMEEDENNKKRRRPQKAFLYRLDADGFAEQLWESPAVPIYSLTHHEGKLLVGAGDDGHIYEVDGDNGDHAILHNGIGSKPMTLLPEEGGAIAVLGASPGRVMRMDDTPAREGAFTSDVIDAGEISTWGRLHWRNFGGGDVTAEVRQGNSAKPNDTWTEWTSAGSGDSSLAIGDEPSRYVQWRVTLEGGRETPSLGEFETFYRPPNRGPRLKGVTVHPQAKGAYNPRSKGGAGRLVQELEGGVTVTYNVKGRKPEGGGKWLPLRGMRTVSWEAFDPDADTLHYTVAIQRTGSDEWITLAEDYKERFFAFDTTMFPDGTYRFEIAATDRAANPQGEALEDSLLSDSFTIDNSAPEIEGLEVEQQRDGTFLVTARVEDALSLLSGADFEVNRQERTEVIPEDLIFDSQSEAFSFTFDYDGGAAEGAQRILYFRVADRDENIAVESVLF